LVITDVQTTAAPVTDFEALPQVQAALASRDLLPREHLVDSGYMSAAHLVDSKQKYQVSLVGARAAGSKLASQDGRCL
jgi:transposase